MDQFPSPPPADAAPRVLGGRGVLLSLGLFFGAIFTANGMLAYSALSTLPGKELANSYDESQSWNQRIAEAKAQDERGWRGVVSAKREGAGARVNFEVADRGGAAVGGLSVVARLEHPSDRRQDIQFPLGAGVDGYGGLVSPVRAGDWTLEIEARRNGDLVYATRNHVSFSASAKE